MEGLTSLVIGGGGACIGRATTAAYAEHGAAGAIRTAVSAAFQPDDEVDEVPLGRYGTVADVADAAVCLGSPESAYVTGQRLVVEGGVSVRGPIS